MAHRGGEGAAGEQAAQVRRSGLVRLLCALGCFFFLTGIMQSLVSVRGVDASLASVPLGLTLGVASGGLGVLTDLPFAGWADLAGPHKVTQAGFAVAVAAAFILIVPGRLALLVGAVLFGLGSSAAGNALLSWLGSARPRQAQGRLQGLNGSVQRVGALVAAGVVGLAVALRSPSVMAVAAAAVSAIALLAAWPRHMRLPPSEPPAALARRPQDVILRSFQHGLALLSDSRIRMSALISLAINVIFLETNSYIPLIHGNHRAVVIGGGLVARDTASVVVGLIISASRRNVAAPIVVAVSLAVAGLSAIASSYADGGPVLVAWAAVQGAVVGVCIAAANLFTIDATATANRTVGMAASLFPSRLMFLVLPTASSIVLQEAGLPDVFRLLGCLMLLFAVGAVLPHRIFAGRTAAAAVASGGERQSPGSPRSS